MTEFRSETVVACAAEDLNRLLRTPARLPEIADPELRLEILEAPETVSEGDEIEVRVTAYGFKQRIRHCYTVVSDSEITTTQLEGPTRQWVHRQLLTPLEDGSCRLEDVIEFEAPGGMLGFVMNDNAITESISNGMDYRYSALAELFGPAG